MKGRCECVTCVAMMKWMALRRAFPRLSPKAQMELLKELLNDIPLEDK